MADEEEKPVPRGAAEGIPETPAGTPVPDQAGGDATTQFDEGVPVGPTPAADFWDVLYGRRSIRRFDERAVPRELVDQVMHAGIWAPSSCNYQMWDLVAVDDAKINAKLGKLSLQMANAPVNVVVSYGRAFSEEAWANVQSASALIENMSLAAHALGLGTFWITQMGDAEKVRETVGLPYDRLVIAVLAVGYPKFAPRGGPMAGPKRRPLSQVTHWNHYAGEPIPSSADPAAWNDELIAIYQRARVMNGLRHNKPRAWEVRALEAMLARFAPAETLAGKRWLDVLPCTGILTERMASRAKGAAFDVVERTPEVAAFVAGRTRPKAGACAWPTPRAGFPAPEDGAYDVATCLFRLEGLTAERRAELLASIARWLKPGGELLLGYVSRRSFHDWTERLRARRGGPQSVEYVLSPDPNIGPFESLEPRAVEALVAKAGFRIVDRLGVQAAPQPEELSFRTRNFSAGTKKLVGAIGATLQALERVPGVQARRGRFRFLRLAR